MKNLNEVECGENFRNTGRCGCVFDPKLIIGKILVPLTLVLTKAQLNAIQETLEGLVEAPQASRIYPVQGLAAVTDSSEDPTFFTFGYGTPVPVKEGNYNWVFSLSELGVDANNALRSFNGSKYAEIYFDNKNRLIGTAKKDADGQPGLAGVPQLNGYPYTYPWKVNDGTNPTGYRTQSQFRPEYVNENIAYFEVPVTDYLLTELEGLQDIRLTIEEIDEAGTTATVTARNCGENTFDAYADALAEPTAWLVPGKAVTGVVKNEAAEGWDVTVDGAFEDGDIITLAAPTVLAAAPINISGYEGSEAIVELGS